LSQQRNIVIRNLVVSSLLLLASLASFSAFAGASCPTCAGLTSFESELLALNPLNSHDFARGVQELDKVESLLGEFAAKASSMSDAKEYFKALVRLSALTAPYGAEAVEALEDLMRNQPEYKALFPTALATVTSYCHRELLRSMISTMEYANSERDARAYGKGHGPKSSEPKPFRFLDCVKAAKKRASP
jgi:hypothetical protein